MAEPCDINEVVKTQWIRLWDVFGIGPLMIIAGLAARHRRPVIGPTVAFFGGVTIWYNARNYLRVRRMMLRARNGNEDQV